MPIKSGKNLTLNFKTNKFFLLLVLAFLSFSGSAQIDIQRYTTATDTFYWKRYIQIPKPQRVNLKRFSVSQPGKKIDSFLARHLSQFPVYLSDTAPRFTLKDLRKCLNPADINGDNLPDMIFSGYNDWKSEIVQIWINRRDSFELVFEDCQYISGIKRAEKKMLEIQICDVGADTSYLYFTRDYRVEQEAGNPIFIRGKQVVSYKHTEEPFKYYPLPIPFTSKSDTLMLRASAALQNEPFIPQLDSFGNIIAKFRTQVKGQALAYKSNGKGNDWFFVEISPSTTPSASILYETDKLPTFIRGWVSGRSIRLN
jgi:hypothetical protein